MLIACDKNDKRVHINETQSNQEYYCPCCGSLLITKKGDMRQHHFAHHTHCYCSDTWERNRLYDLSEWHSKWQACFPIENQEIRVSKGEITHRADVIIGKTVVEFQHSFLSSQVFEDRTNFYDNLDYQVVWLFDISESVKEGKIVQIASEDRDHLFFAWQNPKETFNCYKVEYGCVDLFFQLSEEEASIVHVEAVSKRGFEEFQTSSKMTKTQFLEFVGLKNGKCLLPNKENVETNQEYCLFKAKYNIVLNQQQERAVQMTKGHTLLLAVPGSGKTTVLVAKIGYLIFDKKVSPNSILALTYNKQAACEMKDRFIKTFGKTEQSVQFRTINSLSLLIYCEFCENSGRKKRDQINEEERRKIIISVLKKERTDYISESDIIELETAISYVKNMMLESDEREELNQTIHNFSVMYSDYQAQLSAENKMDFDDQMVFAEAILSQKPEVLCKYQKMFQYVCVDEAQDTSKIQHRIIRLISEPNALFMVGDEDQSIYGFRAAYPKALLNFKYDYQNSYVLCMEINYRSTSKIVSLAQRFISANKGRYIKNMVAFREEECDDVELKTVTSRKEQYQYLLEVAKNNHEQTAFLYRDNESSVVLVDSLLRQGIPFSLKKPEMNFFNNKVVKDVVAFLKLSLNEYDVESFRQICNKAFAFLKEQQKQYVIHNCENKKISVFESFEGQMRYLPEKQRNRAASFKNNMLWIRKLSTQEAIRFIDENGYKKYREKNNIGLSQMEILYILAEREPNKQSFLDRLQTLQEQFSQNFSGTSNLSLSTIHSVKGLEFNNVFLLDVFDGNFPSSSHDFFSCSKDEANGEQEERRLFYVGMTRAKNKLHLIKIKNKPSSFLNELFPERRQIRTEKRPQTRTVEATYDSPNEKIMQQRKVLNERIVKRNQAEMDEAEKQACMIAIEAKIYQQEFQVKDYLGRRWIRCEKCGKKDIESEFWSYGGPNHINLGICRACFEKMRTE